MKRSSTLNQWVLVMLALGFSLFLVAIVVLANRGEIDHYLGFFIALPYGDKIGHFLLMGTLSFLVNLCLKARTFSIANLRLLVGSVVVAAIVSAEELSQAFNPNRTLSLGDWLADIAGIILFGQVAAYLVTRKSRSVD
jgi:VanZ family protein